MRIVLLACMYFLVASGIEGAVGSKCSVPWLPRVVGNVSPQQRAQSQKPAAGAPHDEGSRRAGAFGSPAPWKSVEIGNYYLRRKNYRAALSRFREAVTTDPDYAAGYLGLGKVYDKTGIREKALEAYRKYLELLPSEKDAEDAKSVQKAIERLESRKSK